MKVNKSQRAFAAVTLTTVLSVAFVLIVYAALLGTIQGPGEVTIGGIGGNISYSLDNSTNWQTSQSVTNVGDAWYSRWETTAAYDGLVGIVWQLQRKVDGSWTDVAGKFVNTNTDLNGTAEFVYASSNGMPTLNYNWGPDITEMATYRVTATVTSL